MDVFSHDFDGVVKAVVSLGRVDYAYALENLFPLVNQLTEQRNPQNPKFYERLQRDILQGCLMPPITLAFVRADPETLASVDEVRQFVTENVSEGFILDGIQRLSTLQRAKEAATSSKTAFPCDKSLFVNIIICPSIDNLLYRMITLNNGQKPMTARHQVEILADSAFTFSDSSMALATEKSKTRRTVGVFSRADFELGYMAFLSSSVNIDSQKLIQEKLNELLAFKILDRSPTENSVEFSSVLDLISRLSKEDKYFDQWFKVTNNLIGFCASIREGFEALNGTDTQSAKSIFERFEIAFKSFNVAKIKLGRARRESVAELVKNFAEAKDYDTNHITEMLLRVVD